MNDYLQDIRAFLLANSFKNITVDGFAIPKPNTSQSSQSAINIQGEPGFSDPESPLTKVFFAIYVKGNGTSETRTTINQIRNLLQNRRGMLTDKGSPVVFHHIQTEQEPYRMSATSSGQSMYIARFSSVINNTDTTTVYYQ